MRYQSPPKYDIGPVLESLGAQLPVHVRGGWQPMRCFAHDDAHPSASVNFSTNRFYCWSCGLNEDAIGLLTNVSGLDFHSANKEAARLSPSAGTDQSVNDWRSFF